MTDYTHLQLERDGPVLVVTLLNPPRNLMNAAMVRELTDLASSIEHDGDVRVLVLTGGLEGIFITHYDVFELVRLAARLAQSDPDTMPREMHPTNWLFLKLQSLPQPVIAAINGTAMGGGCELALACDLRLMARGPGRIGLPEVRVGILPGAGGTQRMTRLLGAAKALELMLLGEAVDADTAERLGLVHRACDPERLLPEARALARTLAGRTPLSLALIKRCVLQASELPLSEGLHFEQDALWQTMRSPEAAALMRQYLEGDLPLDEM